MIAEFEKASETMSESSASVADILSTLSKEQLMGLISQLVATSQQSPSNTNNNNDNDVKDDAQVVANQNDNPTNLKNELHTLNNTEVEPEVFELPIDEIVNKINQISDLASLLGNKEVKLRKWYHSLQMTFDNFISDLDLEKERIKNDIIKSLETITRIFSITSTFTLVESLDESVLTTAVRKLIMDYKSESLDNLERYCNENLSLLSLSKDIDENLLKLIPVLSQKLLTFSKKLKHFYSLYDLVDDYKFQDSHFLENLPSRDDINLFNQINRATDIKTILQTNFNKINPMIIEQLDLETLKIKEFIATKLQTLRSLMKKVVALNHELYTSKESNYISLPATINDDEKILLNIGLKTSVFREYEEKLHSYQQLRESRQETLSVYLEKVKHLWSILRPESDEIQDFLRENKNLYTESLMNFENLLIQLEEEKTANIKQFIYNARSKIEGYWNILMYDGDARSKFEEFYVDDETLFDEALLDSHLTELDRLRRECEAIQPLLSLISALNGLIEEKKKLVESSKDVSRLKKRNAFKILRMEELTTNKLNKEFPIVINEIKSKIKEFEGQNGRTFQLNGAPYIEELESIESKYLPRRRSNISHFNSPTVAPTKKGTMNSKGVTRQKRDLITPSRSVIRRRDVNQMTNPFLSRNTSPMKSQANTATPLPSTNTRFTPQSLSKDCVASRGRSPLRKLDLSASIKMNTLETAKQSPCMPVLSSSVSKTISNSSAKRSVLSSNLRMSSPNDNRTSVRTRSPMKTVTNRFNRDNCINNEIKLKIPNRDTPSEPPVEELSDSILEYSDEEQNVKLDVSTQNKENSKPSLTTIFADNNPLSNNNHMLSQFNLSLDSETF